MSDEREYQPGDEIGGYRLERRLGGGGFGSVWRSVPVTGGEAVALKILNGRFSSGDTVRLRAEVELLAASASSSSPHVVRVLGGGVEPVPYVVMEYVDGTDLSRELDRRARVAPPGVFSQDEVIGIARAVASALGVLEASGIIHRDVKPANVLIDSAGVVKVADFGIAKIVGFDSVTATSQLPMSMAYAAPEVWEGHANHQSDIYALGCMLYQCLVGRPPFTGSYAEVFRQHLSAQPDLSALPSDLAPSLRELVRLCLAKQPAERPAGSPAVIALLDLAEAEAATRPAAPAVVPAHEPQGFGPWLREAPHPTQPWAFLCRHETTGERATVEVHFSDDLEHGTRLRKAVAANPALVPLGAERLLGTNRLILRPGERWTDTPPGTFQFWVAREELPIRPGPAVVTRDLLGRLAAQLAALRATAREHGITLSVPPADLSLVGNGEVLLRRPGLAEGDEDGLAWLVSLPLDAEAKSALAGASSVAALVPPVEPLPVFGVAATPDAAVAQHTEPMESDIVQARLTATAAPSAPEVAQAEQTNEPTATDEPDDARPTSTGSMEPPGGSPPGTSRRWLFGGLFGGAAAAAVALALLLMGGGKGGAIPAGVDTPTVGSTPTPPPTETAATTSAATGTPTETPTPTTVPPALTRVAPTATLIQPTQTPVTPTPTLMANYSNSIVVTRLGEASFGVDLRLDYTYDGSRGFNTPDHAYPSIWPRNTLSGLRAANVSGVPFIETNTGSVTYRLFILDESCSPPLDVTVQGSLAFGFFGPRITDMFFVSQEIVIDHVFHKMRTFIDTPC